MDNLKNNLLQYWNQYTLAITAAVLFSTAVLWVVILMPQMNQNNNAEKNLPTKYAELSTMREISGRIKAFEQTLTKEQKEQSRETPLKQVERLARLHAVSGQMTRVSPVQVSLLNGKMTKGMSLDFEGTSLAEMTPFFHAITYKSLLSIQAIDVRRTDNKTGLVNVRITVAESAT